MRQAFIYIYDIYVKIGQDSIIITKKEIKEGKKYKLMLVMKKRICGDKTLNF